MFDFNLKGLLKKKYIITASLIIIGVHLCIFCFSFHTEAISDNETLVHFIDVGQGDSILIQNNNYNILIDSGPKVSYDKLMVYLHENHIKKINILIASHPHEDHIGNMESIINNFDIDEFIAPQVKANTDEFVNMVKALNNKSLKITTVKTGDTINLDSKSSINFLYDGSIKDEDNLNNDSLVFKYVYGNSSVLFTGDAEKEVEDKLLYGKISLKANVLKVSHHGSSTSSQQSFINKVKPKVAIISCGMGNDYGHPNKSTLDALKKAGSTIYRTDLNGTVIIKLDGNTIRVSPIFP